MPIIVMNCLTPGADVIYLVKSIYNSNLYSPIPIIVNSKSISFDILNSIFIYLYLTISIIYLCFSLILKDKEN